MANIEYTLTDHGITCHQCHASSNHPRSMYLRYCEKCRTLLGAEIRQKWNGRIEELEAMCHLFGLYKRCVLLGSDQAHKVPVERIITEGIAGWQIAEFPLWPD